MAAGPNGTSTTSLAAAAPTLVPAGEPVPARGITAADRQLLTQMSYSGTPRGSDGITTPDDIARDMADPVRRMAIFEEMRSGDDAVATAIDARRQEINAANWMLSTEDKTPRGQEILEFCEDNLYPHLDDVLRWLGGGGMQYGFGCLEPVYGWADESPAGTIVRGTLRRARKSQKRALYFQKFAHIRQPTVWTFRISEQGDLQTVDQWVYNGASLHEVRIPAEKVLLWTYDRQGDDRWGVPPTRHCVKAWTFKQQIEKLNLLHIDRFGVGMPVLEEGEGWGEDDRKRAAAFLKGWRSGGGNFIMHPSGGHVEVVTDEGKTSLSMLEWCRYYNLQIAKVFLTQGTELGSTETGARALGETFLDQMHGLVQADCEDLASILNNRLLKRLVDINFGVQKTYPMFAPSERVTLSGGVGTMLQSLITAGAIHPRPEDEAFLREAMGLPAVAIEVLSREAEERKVAAQAAADAARAAADAKTGAGGDKGPPAGRGSPAPDERPKPAPAAPAKAASVRALAAVVMAEGAPPPAVPGVSTYRTREFAAWEQSVLRPDVLEQDLDLHESRLTAEVRDVLALIDASLAEQAAAHANDGPEALAAAVRTIAVPAPLVEQLREAVQEGAERARAYGADAVRAEITRQLGPPGAAVRDGNSPYGYPWLPAADGSGVTGPTFYSRIGRAVLRAVRSLAADSQEQLSEERARELRLAAVVDAAVEAEVARREQSVRTSMLSALAQAISAGAAALADVVSTAARAALVSLSPRQTASNVAGVVNTGFGIGRSEAAAAVIDPPEGGRTPTLPSGEPLTILYKVYSAVMDLGTCPECSKWDGAQFPVDFPEDMTGVQCPNPRCEGTEARCRCVWIYVTNAEEAPLVPASKGPVPFALDREELVRQVTAASEAAVARTLATWTPAQREQVAAAPIELHVHTDARGGVKRVISPKAADGSYTVTEVPEA